MRSREVVVCLRVWCISHKYHTYACTEHGKKQPTNRKTRRSVTLQKSAERILDPEGKRFNASTGLERLDMQTITSQ